MLKGSGIYSRTYTLSEKQKVYSDPSKETERIR